MNACRCRSVELWKLNIEIMKNEKKKQNYNRWQHATPNGERLLVFKFYHHRKPLATTFFDLRCRILNKIVSSETSRVDHIHLLVQQWVVTSEYMLSNEIKNNWEKNKAFNTEMSWQRFLIICFFTVSDILFYSPSSMFACLKLLLLIIVIFMTCEA